MGQSTSHRPNGHRAPLPPPSDVIVHVPNDSVLNPPRYTRRLDDCFCHGDYFGRNTRQHVIFVAFLDYVNNEQAQPGSTDNTSAIPWNWLAATMGRTNITHTQLVFRDSERREYFTYSTDMVRGVHCMSRKTFSSQGWHFLCLFVDEPTEVRIYNFLFEQHGKSFSRLGMIGVYIRPVDTGGQSWFCSELVIAALRAGGLLLDWPREAYSVPPHELYEKLTTPGALPIEIVKLKNNPVFASEIRRAGYE